MTFSFNHKNSFKTVACISDIMRGDVNLLHSELFKIMGICIPKPVRLEDMSIKDVANQISLRLRDEMEGLCELSSLLNRFAIYEDIERGKNYIIQKRETIDSQMQSCLKLYEKITGKTISFEDIKCSIEGFYSIKAYGIWIEDLYALSIVVDENTSIDILIVKVLCKLGRLYSFCNTIISQRVKISEDTEASLHNYCGFQDDICDYLILAVNKAIEGRPKKNGNQQKKYVNKIINRIVNSPLYLPYHNKEQFVKFIAHSPGVSRTTVFDFLTDVKIVENLNPLELTRPFLKEGFRTFEYLESMLEQAFNMCIAPSFNYSTSMAYCVIWYWLVDYVKIAVAGKPHSIEKFTILMNEIIKSDISPNSMPTIISRNKNNDFSEIMKMLDNVAIIFKLKDFKS